MLDTLSHEPNRDQLVAAARWNARAAWRETKKGNTKDAARHQQNASMLRAAVWNRDHQ